MQTTYEQDSQLIQEMIDGAVRDERANAAQEREHLVALIKLAKRMREVQRKYFRTRTSSAMIEAKNLEVEFDERARALDEPSLDVV